VSAQTLAQLQPFIAALPPECMGQPAYFGPTPCSLQAELSVVGRVVASTSLSSYVHRPLWEPRNFHWWLEVSPGR
jgi:hypothetical protein